MRRKNPTHLIDPYLILCRCCHDVVIIQLFKDVSTGRSTHGMQTHKFDQVIQTPGSTFGEMQLTRGQESDFNRSVQRVLASMYHLRLEEALWSEI